MAEQEERKPRGRRANPNNLNEKGEDVGNKMIGRPEGAHIPLEKGSSTTLEVLIQTPMGRLDKKVYEVFEKYTVVKGKKKLRGKYRRLVKTIKGVKG